MELMELMLLFLSYTKVSKASNHFDFSLIGLGGSNNYKIHTHRNGPEKKIP